MGGHEGPCRQNWEWGQRAGEGRGARREHQLERRGLGRRWLYLKG